MAIVVELNGDSVAFPIASVRTVGVANHEVAGVPIAVTVDPSGGNWAVFSRRLDRRLVELALIGQALVEVDGGGRWDPTTGFGLDDTAENLDLLPGFTSYPDDYWTFYPDGILWPDS
jgi:hypothetical protein